MSARRVLIIDDDRLIRESTAMVLRTAGYEVLTAEDAERGLEVARESQPDLVLIDIMMPEIDGWDALDHALGDARLRKIPFVVFTAREHTKGRQLALARGAADYVQKPYDPDHLIEVVRRNIVC
jgi:CheY-like chemotaxis protein